MIEACIWEEVQQEEHRVSDTNECLVCKAPIEYIDAEEQMECFMCHKVEGSKCRCVNGHFVCNECHSKGMDQMFNVCTNHTSKNPFEVLGDLMDMECCHMNGPEHHVFVSAALITAYKNAGGDIDLEDALRESYVRGAKIPGGTCGFWGACGAAISSGQFVSIVTKSNPLENESWGLCNLMTSRSLESIGEVGGPRCCKRNSWLSIYAAVEFAKEKLGVEMDATEVISCNRIPDNKQCIGKRCPFAPVNARKRAQELEQQGKGE